MGRNHAFDISSCVQKLHILPLIASVKSRNYFTMKQEIKDRRSRRVSFAEDLQTVHLYEVRCYQQENIRAFSHGPYSPRNSNLHLINHLFPEFSASERMGVVIAVTHPVPLYDTSERICPSWRQTYGCLFFCLTLHLLFRFAEGSTVLGR